MKDAETGICTTLDTSHATYKRLFDKWGRLGTRTQVQSAETAGDDQLAGEVRCILHGWAFRAAFLQDGRRIIRNFLISGDMIGGPSEAWPRAFTEVVAATDLECITITEEALNKDDEQRRKVRAELDAALETEVAMLNGQVMRLGGMTMAERAIHLFLELLERHHHAGLAEGGAFWFPISQDLLADALGVSRVHLNRTLQQLRGEGVIKLDGATLELRGVSELVKRVEYESLYGELALPI